MQRVQAAVQRRAGMLDAAHTACRLIHGEADGLPGVIADRYGDVVVLQLSSAGAEHWRQVRVEAHEAAGRGLLYRLGADRFIDCVLVANQNRSRRDR